jgi:hypothetical protein
MGEKKEWDGGSADSRQEGGTHYKDMEIQPWAVMKAVLPPKDFRGFLWGNVIKYLMRAGGKNGETYLQAYKKARHYLDKLIEEHEEEKTNV